jgi:transcriptional regulator with XRE-family HTH domain
VRALRHARGLTLVELAQASGLSHPFLSQVERDLANVSLASLRRIALALETSPVELVAAAESGEENASPTVEITRAGSGAAPVSGFAQGSALALASGARPFLPIVVTADASREGASFVHAEDEFMLVLAGNIVVDLDGESVALAEGDSVYFKGGVVHRWWTDAAEPCRVLVVKQQVAA